MPFLLIFFLFMLAWLTRPPRLMVVGPTPRKKGEGGIHKGRVRPLGLWKAQEGSIGNGK
jgi:hypothetical protein